MDRPWRAPSPLGSAGGGVGENPTIPPHQHHQNSLNHPPFPAGAAPSRFYPRNALGTQQNQGYYRRPRGAEAARTSSFRMVNPERIEAAVAKAKQDLLVAGENVSSWNVAQKAALALTVDSWSALGYQMQEVPTLRELMLVEGKVGAFIHCFVSVRKFTSVHELSVEICKSEGIEQFEELGLGSLLRHPLIDHYFSVPSHVTEVVKITSDEIIGRLDNYLYKVRNKEVVVEEFLDFVAKKHKVNAREELGVRIRSLGLHIKYIKESRRSEVDTVFKARDANKQHWNEHTGEAESPPVAAALEQNQEVDSPFDGISMSVSPPLELVDDGKIDEDGLSTQCQNLSEIEMKNKSMKSIMTELERIGLESGLVFSQEKYKMQTVSKRIDFSKKKTLQVLEDICTFVKTWKEACLKYSAVKVLAMMLQYPETSDKRRGLKKLFLRNPCFVGLLNVFVTLMKFGLLDLICNDFKVILEHGSRKSSSAWSTNVDDAGPSTKTDPLESNESSGSDLLQKNNTNFDVLQKCIPVNDIVRNIENYFSSFKYRGDETLIEKQFMLLKKVRDCEEWLGKQFSFEKFSEFGYGNFIEFLEKNVSMLPTEMQRYFLVGTDDSSSPRVFLNQDQLEVLLCQAESNKLNDNTLSKYEISLILKQQFPTAKFLITGNDVDKYFSELIKKQKDNRKYTCVVFSATLLGKQSIRTSVFSSDKHSRGACGTVTEANQLAGSLKSLCVKDAIECLLKAPMLSDLVSWSHWDALFAPTLGTLLEWLLNEVQIKDFSCVVTSDGKLIKVDNSSTPDEFLDASIHGLSFQAAVKLLSLLSVYGGMGRFPVSLIKCHTQRAFDVMIKNSMDELALKCTPIDHTEKDSSQGTIINDDSQNCLDVPVETIQHNEMSKSNITTVNFAVRFILDCLGYLPSEFQSFAAEIFLSGLQSFMKEAPLEILHGCRHIAERLMLHEIGLSLGVVEWVNDFHTFSSAKSSKPSCGVTSSLAFMMDHFSSTDESKKVLLRNFERLPNADTDITLTDLHHKLNEPQISGERPDIGAFKQKSILTIYQNGVSEDASHVIETIRREEFGLISDMDCGDTSLLEKQHARLGRALHCLSQELYSHDSHLILELIQNADDNAYPEGVQPTLVFILHMSGIIVLNNEEGFSSHNIRALCDIGNSTKKGSNAGYIGKKGIGFKSVFRVTDAPEIHSNDFHLKFDTRDGPIGYILPTEISPCDVECFAKLLSCEDDRTDAAYWKTCIVLPFRSDLREKIGIKSVISMFADLHPSLLLFLHRIQCIKFKSMLNDKLLIMRRETSDDGIIKVSHGREEISWLVVSRNLQASLIRSDIQTTEISIAFTLKELEDQVYKPYLCTQPVFAFLPLRSYGLKFILQGDFVLPSSREEVDGDSAWNQWLLSEYPTLFVSALTSFCTLQCFKEKPGEAVTTFMKFVPLVGEVYGFFSPIPHMIISKLRTSNCLFLEGDNNEWCPPYKVLRGWDEEVRSFLSDDMLRQHLGLGYLSKDIELSNMLSKSLGMTEYGPKVLTDIMVSICQDSDGIKLLGLDWLLSWLTAFSASSAVHSAPYHISNSDLELDLYTSLRKMRLIPLSDGSYSSLDEGPIWLPCDFLANGFDGRQAPEDFPILYSKLRIVNPLLFSASGLHANNINRTDDVRVANIVQIFHKIGVEQLSAHEIIKSHILPTFSENEHIYEDTGLMTEYLCFIMFHFQYACHNCQSEKAELLLELKNNPVILTNHGYKCPAKEPVHFGKEFGNQINIKKLIDPENSSWHVVDATYLKHHSTRLVPGLDKKWREFFQELGVTDFVHVVSVEKRLSELLPIASENIIVDESESTSSLVIDWESPEMVHLLSEVSLKNAHKRCKYLLEVLDKLWDGSYSEKCHVNINFKFYKKCIASSFLKSVQNIRWVMSSMGKLHYPKDVFHDCEAVRSVFGSNAPYTISQVNSKAFLRDAGFKTQVSFDDALSVLRSWRIFEGPFKASVAQMTNFYNIISDGLHTSKDKIIDDLKSNPCIFVPSSTSRINDAVSGVFLSPHDVYWQDPTGCIGKKDVTGLPCKMLANIYPSLCEFFVNECGVLEEPKFGSYFQILLQLASTELPSEAAYSVFKVLLKWADDLKIGTVKLEDLLDLKENLTKLENAVFPTTPEKWVSLHPSFGLVCWSDDEELRKLLQQDEKVHFLQFGELNSHEKEMLLEKVATFLRKIGVPALSEVLTREAVYYGSGDSQDKALLVKWVLPYAQRYLLKFNPDIYRDLKLVVFEKLCQLQIVVVEKLFYKYTLKGHDAVSNKRFDCSCLLQGNTLYMTEASDYHTVFLELSRLFFERSAELCFDGSSELHLANFLLMISAKAESGCTEEEIELFISNNQKIPDLPAGEPYWSLLSPLQVNDQPSHVPLTIRRSTFTSFKKSNTATSTQWPPTNWKSALDSDFSLGSDFRNDGSELRTRTSSKLRVEIDGDFIVEDVSTDFLASFFQNSDIMGSSNSVEQQDTENMLKPNTDIDNAAEISGPDESSAHISTLPDTSGYFQVLNDSQSYATGRLGEAIAYNHFSEKLNRAVKWVNEETETGLPYDLIVGEKEDEREYIEVKATNSTSKDWFPITSREWQFAVKKGDKFSIVHVILDGPKNAKISMLKNPDKLCQKGMLNLIVLMSEQLRKSNSSPSIV